MRTIAKALGAIAFLGAAAAFAPSFFTTTDTTLPIAEAAPTKWKCEACGMIVNANNESDLNYFKGGCKQDKNGNHHWYRLD